MKINGESPSGKAPGSGPGIRGFESLFPSKYMPQIIKSKDNDKIKFLRKLSQKKFRKQYGEFLVENLIIIEDAQKAGFNFEELYVTKDFIKANKERFASLSKSNDYFIIDKKINKSFSSLDTSSGICGVYKKPESKINFDSHIVYLNKISDPGNLGTILRSALAFDIKNIVLDNCADLYNPKTISAAREAIFKLNFEFDDSGEILKEIKTHLPIVATSLQGDSELENLPKDKFCLVLGNEVSGVEEEVLKLADYEIKINMSDNIESLNVASAAAIIFYNIYN